jgi:hypothetical protein
VVSVQRPPTKMDDDTARSLDTTLPISTLIIFKFWEGLFAAFDSLTQAQLQVTIADDAHPVIVSRCADTGLDTTLPRSLSSARGTKAS